MRRVFLLLLLTPLLTNCSDSAPLTAPAGAVLTEEDLRTDEELLAEWNAPRVEEALTAEALAVQSANPPKVMEFGNPEAGTSYPPGAHDQSFHGKDRIIPGTMVIDAGESVTFRVYPGHRVAIYNDGTRPEDIKPNPGPFVLDPTNRLALQAAPLPTIQYTFTKPGKYLVICAIARHFFEANMWGWVIVR